MIVDFDDFAQDNHRLDLLHRLKEANPLFRCTLFAVPGQGSWQFWEQVPRWCELAVHGWEHPDPRECETWTKERMLRLMDAQIVQANFVRGFKAPGWQISDGCYEALAERGWWVADQPYNNDRRPKGLRVHLLSETASSGGDPDHWHGHIQNVMGNGLEETWDVLLGRVAKADSFQLVSEAVQPWNP